VKRLRLIVSLVTEDNDYQREQATAAQEMAHRLNVDVSILYADGDPITQSQQLLNIIQGPGESRPDGIALDPASGTSLPHVAQAAVSAGIGWAVMNREAAYLQDLRSRARVPVFCVTSNHLEAGRIQAQQVAALLPKGGNVVYLQGPSDYPAATQRTHGMQQRKPANVTLIQLRGKWTEESGYKSVSSWARLSTSQKLCVDMFCAQNDAMAMGARKAIQELPDSVLREKWLKVPYTGVDGLPKTGQAFVRSGLLAATVLNIPNTYLAVELFAEALRKGTNPPALSLTVPSSFPKIEELTTGKLAREKVLTHQ
jgi:ABC-type sugar transport system substrate-binding protein